MASAGIDAEAHDYDPAQHLRRSAAPGRISEASASLDKRPSRAVNMSASGDFERVILENITARAHFLVLLTPSALERCDDPSDLFRREIETALDSQRANFASTGNALEWLAYESRSEHSRAIAGCHHRCHRGR